MRTFKQFLNENRHFVNEANGNDTWVYYADKDEKEDAQYFQCNFFKNNIEFVAGDGDEVLHLVIKQKEIISFKEVILDLLNGKTNAKFNTKKGKIYIDQSKSYTLIVELTDGEVEVTVDKKEAKSLLASFEKWINQ